MKAESEVERGVWGRRKSLRQEDKDLGVQGGVSGSRSLALETVSGVDRRFAVSERDCEPRKEPGV